MADSELKNEQDYDPENETVNEPEDIEAETETDEAASENVDEAVGETEEKEAVPDEEADEGEHVKDVKKEKKFGRKKDKKTGILEEKLAELEDKRVRQLAEFENFRKRSEKEKSQMFEIGAKTVIEKILPVIDNFERGFDAMSDEERETPFVQGIELVYKQLMTAMDELGVKAIEAVGLEFDPNIHNAVMAVDDDSLESGTVAEELQKGYMYKESVVRHSMVKVVN